MYDNSLKFRGSGLFGTKDPNSLPDFSDGHGSSKKKRVQKLFDIGALGALLFAFISLILFGNKINFT